MPVISAGLDDHAVGEGRGSVCAAGLDGSDRREILVARGLTGIAPAVLPAGTSD
ncbi:hypothetical protein ACWEN3_16750 [Streptomyces sp. NPDC004561]